MKIAKATIQLLVIILMTIITSQQSYSQAKRVTARGDYTFRKAGVHRGNQVRTVFSNYGVIAQPGNQGPQAAWKYDADGYAGDISPVVGFKLPPQPDPKVAGLMDTVHEVVITPVNRPGGGNSNALNGQFGGFEPIPGFANPTLNKIGEGVAMSQLPETWPLSWPDHPDWTYTGKPVIVNGKDETPQVDWNGYFGRGQFNADQESYYWMDDNEDAKMFKVYGFLPDSTDPTRHGQGIQADVRGLQWSNFLAQNVIFWLYDFTNDGTTTYDQVAFGTLVGTYVGISGDEYNDDASFFDVRNAITYTWDIEPGLGIEYVRPEANPNWQPNPFAVGYISYAFLESPGNATDGIDNDGDNVKFDPTAPYFTENDFKPHIVQAGDKLVLIDKQTFKRSIFVMPNDTVTVYSMGVPFFLKPGVTSLVEGNIDANGNLNPNAYDGIDNNLNGLIDENYLVDYRQFKKSPQGVVLIDTVNPVQYKNYVTGQGVNAPMIDEARDDGIDNNKNWVTFDDVGLDGKPNTHDFGEGDGLPTSGYQKPGVVPGLAAGPVNIYGLQDTHEPGEPDIDKTDVQESDQIGLTSFQYFTPAGAINMAANEDMWKRITPGLYDVPASVVNNTNTHGEDGDFIMGSGYFPLSPGQTERFSLALGFGDNLTQTIKTKQIAQLIYNANYNFPQPPDKPTLTVVPANGQITLYWDRVAESTIDKTTHKIEFEGYKIYKGTDPDFTDALQISDGTGAKVFYTPLYQCDLADGITGYFQSSPTLLSLTNAAPYYLGNDSGIQNYYVDKNVTNGRTYYYAVVAYTKGESAFDIFPSENTHFLSKDVTGTITTDINTAAVIPNAPTLGYVPPPSSIQLTRASGFSSAIPYYEVIDPYAVKDSTYKLTFLDSLVNGVPIAYAYNVTNAGNGGALLKKAKLLFGNGYVFDGVRLWIDTSYQNTNAIVMDTLTSGWNHPSKQNLTVIPVQKIIPSANIYGIRYPKTYKFVFDNTYKDSSNSLTQAFGGLSFPIKATNFKIYDATDSQHPVQVQYAFTEAKKYFVDTLSNLDQVYVSDSAGKTLSWDMQFYGADTSNIPQLGDTLTVDFTKPLSSKDEFTFSTSGPTTDQNSLQAQLDKIRAVPNPYIVTDVFEQSNPSTIRGRGQRIIDFTNLPMRCTIKIYTSSGDLVKTLEQNGDINNGSVTWDLRSNEGLDVAFGVYFYVVEVPNSSAKKIGKLAVIK